MLGEDLWGKYHPLGEGDLCCSLVASAEAESRISEMEQDNMAEI